MPIVYHLLRNSKIPEASVEKILKNGIKSKQQLMDDGDIPFEENVYKVVARSRDKWLNEMYQCHKNDKETFFKIIEPVARNNAFVSEYVAFEEPLPKSPYGRQDNVFFTYSKNPPSNYDWGAIEVPNKAQLRNSYYYKGHCDIVKYADSAMTLEDFANTQQSSYPFRWGSYDPECSVPYRVPADKIVAYAKVEKELPIGKKPLEYQDLTKIKKVLNAKLNFATQFSTPEDNVLIDESNGKYQIRISFNKNSAQNKQQEITKVFQSFDSIDELLGLNTDSQDVGDWNIVAAGHCCVEGG